jgi:hypothetical protein
MLEKVNDKRFQKVALSNANMHLFKGGESGLITKSQTAIYESTYYFWEDTRNVTDSTEDTQILPAANNISSR